MLRISIILASAVLLLGAMAGSAAAQTPPKLDTAEDVLDWIAANPDHAGLTVLAPGSRPLRHNADERFPLASVRKVLIAGALVDRERRLSRTVPRAAVDRWILPGLQAGYDMKADGLTAPRLSLGQLAQAALVPSNNAASDALLAHLGTGRVDAWARRQGMRRQDPIVPLFGEIAAWGSDPRWAERSTPSRTREALRTARLQPDQVKKLPSIETQLANSRHSVSGTPAEWARLMRRIGRRGDQRLQSLLNWPLKEAPAAREQLDAYYTKGGNYVNVRAEASFIKPKGKPGVAVTLFLRDLPPEVAAALGEPFAELVAGLATDPALRARAAKQLVG